MFEQTARLAVIFSYRPDSRMAQADRGSEHFTIVGHRRGRSVLIVREENLDNIRKILELLDDIAFLIVKLRNGFDSETSSYQAYVAFLKGYEEHISFLQTGDVAERDRAIAGYEYAISTDYGYELARYNLGNLLYDRYTATSNKQAIEHYLVASRSDRTLLRALALSGLAMAYGQNSHRYSLPTADEWIELADDASRKAEALATNLEEAILARAWALQVAGQVDDAIEKYESVAALSGDSEREKQMKSFARNNQAYLMITEFGDLDRAQALLKDGLSLHENKMIHANLGELYRRRRMYEDALREYSRTIEIDPCYANALNESGMVYLEMAGDVRPTGDAVEKLLGKAYQRHVSALKAVDEKQQRMEIRKKFEKFRAGCGFSRSSVRSWRRTADKLVKQSTAQAGLGPVPTAPRAMGDG
jgi:tetratricopeptide (TPR) repeat protein